MKNNLTQNIFIGFMLGVFFGVILNVSNLPVHIHNNLLVFLSFGGDVFLKTIKMLVVPIVFFSLVNGVANLRNIASLGRIGSKSILIYLLTTCIAITMSLFLANIIQPGQGFGRNSVATDIEITNPPSFFDILLNIIPNNPFASLVEGEMLQVILFSILIGSSISVLKNTMVIKKFFNEFNQVVMQILSFVMTIAPFGIFCLISKTFATQGLNSILELLKYFLLVAFVLFLHVFLIYEME